jgi:hypothetical protein
MGQFIKDMCWWFYITFIIKELDSTAAGNEPCPEATTAIRLKRRFPACLWTCHGKPGMFNVIWFTAIFTIYIDGSYQYSGFQLRTVQTSDLGIQAVSDEDRQLFQQGGTVAIDKPISLSTRPRKDKVPYRFWIEI